MCLGHQQRRLQNGCWKSIQICLQLTKKGAQENLAQGVTIVLAIKVIEECVRIVTLMAERYGANPYVGVWQTDNEYARHDTTHSYSDSARTAFKSWLRVQYAGSGNDGDINALNEAWGNVFWSMEYENFDQIDLPNLTVTQPNPSHVLDFRRFSSDQVISFNRLQTDIIKSYSDAPIAHNFMGKTLEFDHFKVGEDLT